MPKPKQKTPIRRAGAKTNGKPLPKSSKLEWIDEVIVPVEKFNQAATRTLADFPRAVPPQSRDAALVTSVRAVQAKTLQPVMESLQRLATTKDWTVPVFVATEGKAFDWQTAPLRKYESFEDFYRKELEKTWGDWSTLQRTYGELVAGKISGAAAVKQITQRAAVAATAAVTAAAAQPPVNVRPQGVNARSHRWTHDDEPQAVRASKSGIGVTAQRELDYLARHRPDLRERVASGELSCSAAHREARGLPKLFVLRYTIGDIKGIAKALRRQLSAEQLAELKELL